MNHNLGRAIGPSLLLLFGLASSALAATPVAVDIGSEVTITELADGVWMHTSYREVDGFGRVLSNGLLVLKDTSLFMIDTAWDDTQTDAILDWSLKTLGRVPDGLVASHAHADKMGGVGAFHQRNIPTYALERSNELAPDHDVLPAKNGLKLESQQAQVLGPMVIYYPGPGHAEDNLVVYLPDTGILHGGCLIRPLASGSLGNTASADVSKWDLSVASVEARFPEATVVVPSHGPVGGVELLAHTNELVKAQRSKTPSH